MPSPSESQKIRKYDLRFILDSPVPHNQPVPRSQPVPYPQPQPRTPPHYLGQGDTACAPRDQATATRSSGIVTSDRKLEYSLSNPAQPSDCSYSILCFDNRQPSIPSPLSPPWLSAGQRNHHDIHTVSSSDGTQYIYIGRSTGPKRNVLQRIEDMSMNLTIKSFGPSEVVCAGCSHTYSIRNGFIQDPNTSYSDSIWTGTHQATCKILQSWRNPSSTYRPAPATQAELARLRMASRDAARI
ncbi:hypothetical protein BD626DRAFT_627645 [Schizophyllum amplum]|uniref:Uncharacterized protein n=1 Tax=Schizophyllum amplum TaxID=97359 RepID=A0A550CR22_9AGAR|nr:hypothetical protein BD626DRAFT_627645 [Auriculariopsis ampla]